jgi:hypothetical protein
MNVAASNRAALVTLSEDDLKARLPVWKALSQFWLDTELQESELNYIVRVIAESPYCIEEVQAIHRNEVAPAVGVNLVGVAGEWAGFDDQWLAVQCHENALRSHGRLRRTRLWLQAPCVRLFTDHYWREVLPRVHAIRSGAVQQGAAP